MRARAHTARAVERCAPASRTTAPPARRPSRRTPPSAASTPLARLAPLASRSARRTAAWRGQSDRRVHRWRSRSTSSWNHGRHTRTPSRLVSFSVKRAEEPEGLFEETRRLDVPPQQLVQVGCAAPRDEPLLEALVGFAATFHRGHEHLAFVARRRGGEDVHVPRASRTAARPAGRGATASCAARRRTVPRSAPCRRGGAPSAGSGATQRPSRRPRPASGWAPRR